MWPINPANNELDRLSKFIIFITEAINKKVRHKLNVNQWTVQKTSSTGIRV